MESYFTPFQIFLGWKASLRLAAGRQYPQPLPSLVSVRHSPRCVEVVFALNNMRQAHCIPLGATVAVLPDDDVPALALVLAKSQSGETATVKITEVLNSEAVYDEVSFKHLQGKEIDINVSLLSLVADPFVEDDEVKPSPPCILTPNRLST